MAKSKLLFAACLFGASGLSHAGVIVGESTLLNSAGLNQLETWLGQGQLTLTNTFTKTNGSNSGNFHSAANGKGATFTLMSASEDGGRTWYTIGGYDPVSWSTGGWIIKTNPADWTAFVFNLTRQVKLGQSRDWQTLNHPSFGPVFGYGYDLGVYNTLSLGLSDLVSYGGADVYHTSIVDGSAYDGPNMQIGALEVFTISGYTPPAGAVPEPASLSLLGWGLAAFAAARRRKAKPA